MHSPPAGQTIGERLRYWRLTRGWSRRALERACAVPHPTIANIETNKHAPNSTILARIAAALDICPGRLFPGTPTCPGVGCPCPTPPDHGT
jgi:transcriptional regulator with XRE-family HTH domain